MRGDTGDAGAGRGGWRRRNYGGVAIIFDRLFGALGRERADEQVRCGLARRALPPNPIRLAFREWGLMLRDG